MTAHEQAVREALATHLAAHEPDIEYVGTVNGRRLDRCVCLCGWRGLAADWPTHATATLGRGPF